MLYSERNVESKDKRRQQVLLVAHSLSSRLFEAFADALTAGSTVGSLNGACTKLFRHVKSKTKAASAGS